MGDDAVAHLPAQVQPFAIFFQHVHHAQALPVVGKPIGAQSVECPLPRMAEGCMAQIVPQGDGLGEVLIQAQRAGDGAGNLTDFQRMGQPGTIVVPFRRKENLGLLFQPPERLAVQNPVPVPLKARADRIFRLRHTTSAARFAQRGIPAQRTALNLLCFFPNRHRIRLLSFPLSYKYDKTVPNTLFF